MTKQYLLSTTYPTDSHSGVIPNSSVEIHFEPANKGQRFYVTSTYPDKRSYKRGFWCLNDATSHEQEELKLIRELDASTY